MPPGLEIIKIAKQNGTWDALNEVEDLVIPEDMMEVFNQHKTALFNWNNFPPSSRRGILEWIFNAKRPETRKKRILETVQMANENKRANQYK